MRHSVITLDRGSPSSRSCLSARAFSLIYYLPHDEKPCAGAGHRGRNRELLGVDLPVHRKSRPSGHDAGWPCGISGPATRQVSWAFDEPAEMCVLSDISQLRAQLLHMYALCSIIITTVLLSEMSWTATMWCVENDKELMFRIPT